MEELNVDEQMNTEGGKSIATTKTIHVNAGVNYSAENLFSVSIPKGSVRAQIYISQLRWIFGGNDFEFVCRGKGYNAQNQSSAYNTRLTNQQVSFRATGKAPKAMAYIVVRYWLADTETTMEFSNRFYAFNVQVDK